MLYAHDRQQATQQENHIAELDQEPQQIPFYHLFEQPDHRSRFPLAAVFDRHMHEFHKDRPVEQDEKDVYRQKAEKDEPAGKGTGQLSHSTFGVTEEPAAVLVDDLQLLVGGIAKDMAYPDAQPVEQPGDIIADNRQILCQRRKLTIEQPTDAARKNGNATDRQKDRNNFRHPPWPEEPNQWYQQDGNKKGEQQGHKDMTSGSYDKPRNK